MQKNIDKALAISEIAGTVNLSPSHLTTTFKKKTGFTLIEYFNQLKTQKACQYLLFTDLRVNEIADKLGFDDPYYFTRMFTKIIGVSPVKYRSKRKVDYSHSLSLIKIVHKKFESKLFHLLQAYIKAAFSFFHN